MALSSPAAALRSNAWRWLVVAFSSAKQKQQLHQQQLTNDSTILFTFTSPVNLDLFNLSTVSFGSILANLSEAIHILVDASLYVFGRWWGGEGKLIMEWEFINSVTIQLAKIIFQNFLYWKKGLPEQNLLLDES